MLACLGAGEGQVVSRRRVANGSLSGGAARRLDAIKGSKGTRPNRWRFAQEDDYVQSSQHALISGSGISLFAHACCLSQSTMWHSL